MAVVAVAPDLGERPIAEIEPFELLAVLKKVEASGRLETAKRLLAFAGRVFRYAVATTRAKRNVAADLQGALVAPKVKHHAAIIEPGAVGALLRAIDGFDGQPVTLWALRLAPHVFVRPGELRQAEWSEIDLDAAVWRIPARRMKMKREHVVPLVQSGCGDPYRSAGPYGSWQVCFSWAAHAQATHVGKHA